LIAYVALVPLFAIAYCQLPGSFYAPYARLEHAGRGDEYEIGKIVQTAIRRKAEDQGDMSLTEYNWEISSAYVQRLHATTDGMVTFDLYVMAKHRTLNKGVVQMPVTVSLKSASKMLMPLEGSKEKIYRIFQIEELAA